MVGITNLTNQRINRGSLKRIIQETTEAINGKKLKEISLVLVDEEKIEEINKKYRRQNRSTDVLSFEDLNEIFICPPAIKKQAKNLKIPYKTELTRVVIHGILHLAGYEHEKGGHKAAEMKRLEDKILREIL